MKKMEMEKRLRNTHSRGNEPEGAKSKLQKMQDAQVDSRVFFWWLGQKAIK
jgi:hypothetical protein